KVGSLRIRRSEPDKRTGATSPDILIGTRLDRFSYYVTRTSFNLFVNSGEIFANDTKADHQKTANDEFEQNHRSETGEGATGQFQVECLDSQTNRKEKKDYASKRNQMQWER